MTTSLLAQETREAIDVATKTTLTEYALTLVCQALLSSITQDKKTGVVNQEITVVNLGQSQDAQPTNLHGAFANGLLPSGLMGRAAMTKSPSYAKLPMSVILKILMSMEEPICNQLVIAWLKNVRLNGMPVHELPSPLNLFFLMPFDL